MFHGMGVGMKEVATSKRYRNPRTSTFLYGVSLILGGGVFVLLYTWWWTILLRCTILFRAPFPFGIRGKSRYRFACIWSINGLSWMKSLAVLPWPMCIMGFLMRSPVGTCRISRPSHPLPPSPCIPSLQSPLERLRICIKRFDEQRMYLYTSSVKEYVACVWGVYRTMD